MPRLFGKNYMWGRGRDGRLELWSVDTFVNVPQRYALGPPSFDDLMATLGKIAEEGGVWHASGESQGRIPLGQDRDGVLDPEGSGDAGRSDQRVSGAERHQVARQEGHREEGTGSQADPVLRTCTSCWFDSHTGCPGPARCACWQCYEEEA